jgi:hypothetical protein
VASEIVIVNTSHSDDELRALSGWFRDEDEFRGRVQLQESVAPGQMGGVLDSVTVMVSSGTAGAFVSSIFTWLTRKRDVRKVSLKVRSEAGRELEMTCGSADDAEVILDNITRFLNDEG